MADYNSGAGPSVAGGGDGMTQSLVDQEEEQKPKRPGGIRGAFIWFMENPFNRWPFALFLLFAALTFIWLVMFFSSPMLGYILAGVSAILMSLYGANHFRILLGLKEEVDKMARLNRDFREENKALKVEVKKLGNAREQLEGVENELKASNERLRENLGRFRQLDENLKKLNVQNIEGLQKVQKSSEAVMNRWQESLERHERGILTRVRRQFEWADDKPGLSQEEFEGFMRALPPDYQQQFDRMGKTFADFAGDDGEMDMEEFQGMIDEWVKSIAEHGGSN